MAKAKLRFEDDCASLPRRARESIARPAPMPTDLDVAPPQTAAPVTSAVPVVVSTRAPAPKGVTPWQAAPRRRGRRRFWRLTIGGLALGLLTGGFLWIAALFAPPQGVDVLLIGANYDQNLAVPTNVYGWNSLQDVADTVDTSAHRSYWARRFWQARPTPVSLTTDISLADVAPTSNSHTCLLFLSAHGGADSEGAYLVAEDDLAPSHAEHRLRLTTLLEYFKNLPEKQHKVLVLDCVHFECDPTLGMLTNEFATEVAKLAPEIEAIPNLVVICASSSNELSWPCPALGRTSFAHFWIEGLRGAATDGNSDGRVCLSELMDFATHHTTQWVSKQYQAQQTPWLLPSGEEGTRRARRIDLAWRDGDYQPSEPTLLAPAAVPPELEQAWRTAAALNARPVPPYVYQPQTWRRYLASLRRYEQLLLAGETRATQRLAAEVQTLALQCQHDPTQWLASLDTQRASTAFAQPASPQLRGQAQDVLQALARVPMDQWPAAWQKQLANAGSAQQPLRAEILQLLIEQAISDPTQRLAPVHRLANIVRDPQQPLCPTLHFAVMLDRDLPAAARTLETAPLIALAIRVRQLAEQATTGDAAGFTPSSPRVRSWVADRIADADLERQCGEDLLFASETMRPEAQAKLAAAESLYRRAIADGRVVLDAYQVRDRAAASLPELSMAIVALARERAAEHPTFGQLTAELEQAWTSLQALSAGLQAPGATEIQSPESATTLRSSAKRLEQHLASVEQQITALWQDLANEQYSGERLCLTYLPSLPSLDVDLRVKAAGQYLQRLQHRREDMSQTMTLAAKGKNADPLGISGSTTTDLAVQLHAQQRGRLALAMLGPDEFKQLGGAKRFTWSQAEHRLDVFRVDADWRSSLGELGHEIADRWQQLPQKITQLVAEQQATTAQSPTCILADELARNVPPQFFPQLTNDGCDCLRRRRLSAYLAWQAERTWCDHWYGERNDETPYYLARSRALLADAQRVSQQGQAFAALAARLSGTNDWTLNAPTHEATIPEEALQVVARLVPQSGEGLTGAVTVRVTPGLGLQSTGPTSQIVAWPLQHGTVELPLTATTSSDGLLSPATLNNTTLGVSAYYRGHWQTAEIAVAQRATPELAIVEPAPPPGGMIAVETSPELAQRFGRGDGAVVVVLDCSGSMGAPVGQPFSNATRYAQATQALATVIAKLPAGTQLSVWTFGEAQGVQKTVKEAETTIRCLRPLATWDPADKAALAALVKSFSYPTVEPWNESAVVHAMISAKESLTAARGSKTMIVITDGIDNRYERDVLINPRKLDVATGLAENFRGTGIAINVVGFQVASHEEEAARQQFSVIETLDPPGRFYSVSQSSELLAALSSALDQRLRYWVEDYDRRPLAGEAVNGSEPELTTVPLPRDRMGAAAGEYRLRVIADRPLERPLIVSGGDFVLAQLNSVNNGVVIERGSVLERLYPEARLQTAGQWRAGLLRTGFTSVGPSMEIALERQPDANELQLANAAPREVWWECSLACDAAHTGAVRATRTFTTGLPAWRVKYLMPAGETAPAAFTGSIAAWWMEDDFTTSRAKLIAGRDFQDLNQLIGRTVTTDDQPIRIRDVRWQPQAVGGQLTIVVEGAPGESPWLRLDGVPVITTEHRHYPSLSRYAGVFTLPDELPPQGWRLELRSLAQLKRVAEQQGTHVRFDNVLLQRSPTAPPSGSK
jgi:hypothetical protein